MSYLIDTNIIIYSVNGHEGVRKKFAEHADSPKQISLITYGELLFGALKSTSIEKNCATVARIKQLFPVIDIDCPIMETFAAIKARLVKTGNTTADFDILVAATALVRNCTLVTHNVRHFEYVKGLKIEDWAAPADPAKSY